MGVSSIKRRAERIKEKKGKVLFVLFCEYISLLENKTKEERNRLLRFYDNKWRSYCIKENNKGIVKFNRDAFWNMSTSPDKWLHRYKMKRLFWKKHPNPLVRYCRYIKHKFLQTQELPL